MHYQVLALITNLPVLIVPFICIRSMKNTTDPILQKTNHQDQMPYSPTPFPKLLFNSRLLYINPLRQFVFSGLFAGISSFTDSPKCAYPSVLLVNLQWCSSTCMWGSGVHAFTLHRLGNLLLRFTIPWDLASTHHPTQAKIPKYLGEQHWRGGWLLPYLILMCQMM